MNKQIDLITKQLVNILNNSGLPIGVAYLIIKDLYNQLYMEYDKSIRLDDEKIQSHEIQTPDMLENYTQENDTKILYNKNQVQQKEE